MLGTDPAIGAFISLTSFFANGFAASNIVSSNGARFPEETGFGSRILSASQSNITNVACDSQASLCPPVRGVRCDLNFYKDT